MATATIGVDCQVILDGTGYWIEPRSYVVQRPRVRKATIVRGGGERYVDAGPGRREWSFVVLALNDIKRYDGRPTAISGEQYRDALVASYNKVAQALAFTDPFGVAFSVRFDDYIERIKDLRTQLTLPAYFIDVRLVEV
jgi:hypothetical protein